MTHTPFAESQHDRRYRRPLQPVAGHPDIPVYERRTDSTRAAGHGAAMGRVLHLHATGIWAVRLNGELAEIGGCRHWPTREALTAAASAAGIPLSDLIYRTGAPA